MRILTMLLLATTTLLASCAIYVPDDGYRGGGRGGPGNDFCPPGQAKKGNC
ncbi:hypothetical protein [Pandoraea sp. CB10b_02]|uniref:hypothetical protein n=1 Tax=Pandoraea sp. CB10b_02 TaxID=2014535 RepID=UPI0025798F61|nr:hypothetical protein [Pandoraea sp. CB10b_02]